MRVCWGGSEGGVVLNGPGREEEEEEEEEEMQG